MEEIKYTLIPNETNAYVNTNDSKTYVINSDCDEVLVESNNENIRIEQSGKVFKVIGVTQGTSEITVTLSKTITIENENKPPVVEPEVPEISPPLEKPEEQVVETPDYPDDQQSFPNFTDEELEVLMINRKIYEQLKQFFVDYNLGLDEHSHVVDKPMDISTRDKNMIDDKFFIKQLYDNCKNDIQKIRSENPSPKLKEANINVIKEASMKLTAIYNSLYTTTVVPYFWYDEIPTLTSSNPMQAENIKKLQPLLNIYFKVNPKTKENFIFNAFMLSFNDRNEEFSELHKILEYYLMNTYEDYKWFKENLSNIDLTILEQYPYMNHFKSNEKYNSLNDESKKDAIYFYCGQIILSSMTNPSHTTKLTREKIKEEILKLT